MSAISESVPKTDSQHVRPFNANNLVLQQINYNYATSLLTSSLNPEAAVCSPYSFTTRLIPS
jgi:hypothetical protein